MDKNTPESHKLKVAYILGTFPQLTQTFINREILWIAEQDIDTHIFSLNKPRTYSTDRLVDKIKNKVIYSRYISYELIKAQLYYFWRMPHRYIRALYKTILFTYREPLMFYRALAYFPKSIYFARLMKELNIEHIHAHFITHASISASTISIILGIPYSVTAHAVGLFKRNQKSVRRQLEDASQIVTISNYHRDYIDSLTDKIHRDEIGIVHCGLDTNHFQPSQSPNQNGSVHILSVGRLIEKKGFEYLIDACKIVSDTGQTIHCDIIGDGPLEEKLKERIERLGLHKQVKLVGALEQTRVLEMYQNSDLFVLACVIAENGNRDGLPVVLIEAMSCELPVITTPVTGISEIAEHEQTCLVVNERDANNLAKSILRLIEDKDMGRKLGKQAREKIIEEFHIQNSTNKLADLFRLVARRNGIDHSNKY